LINVFRNIQAGRRGYLREEMMSKANRRLGRGLSSLIQDTAKQPPGSAQQGTESAERTTAHPKATKQIESDTPARSAQAEEEVVVEKFNSPENAMDSGIDGTDRARADAGQGDSAVGVAGSASQPPSSWEQLPNEARPANSPPSRARAVDDLSESDALIPGSRDTSKQSIRDTGLPTGSVDTRARINEIVPNVRQPRQQFERESIAALAASIARNGLIQPLVVRPLRDRSDAEGFAKYELIAGERRWRASRAAGVEDVPVIVRDVDDEKSLELALIENLQREDLNAIDRADAYARYCDEFGLSPAEVAQRMAEDRSTVVNYLRLRELPNKVKALVADGQLSMGHARAILGVPKADDRAALARSAVTNSLSVRALEQIIRRRKESGDAESANGEPAAQSQGDPPAKSAQIRDLENRFQQALGTKVRIVPGRGRQRGRIVIDYFSFDDFDRILDRLGVDRD
jgi:ParB family chromosome partitioning protein